MHPGPTGRGAGVIAGAGCGHTPASRPASLQRHKYGTMSLMRTTVDIPDGLYRQLKARAAREGSSTRALILRGVKNVLQTERRKAGSPVSLPVVRSKRPGAVALDNATIYDLAFP